MMPWYFYVWAFVAGMLLANGVPHFVQGISGSLFPTPFATPPGVGDSSPRVNVVWGFFNLLAGALLLYFFWPRNWSGWVVLAAGALVLSVLMAGHFGKVRAGKHT
jgi:hypothetical protein